MYVRHAFGMQLIFGKDCSSSGKDRSGFRSTQKCGTERREDLETYYRARAAVRKLSKPERL